MVWDVTTENIKKVLSIAKEMVDNESQPDDITILTTVAMSPELGKPVILFYVIFNGPLASIEPYTSPYRALTPLTTMSEEGTYLDVSRWLMMEDGNIACDPSKFMSSPGIVRHPIDIKTYNIDAMSDYIEEFSAFIVKEPEFGRSLLLIEQYPTAKVRANKGMGAIPWRERGLLISPAIFYTTVNTSTTSPIPFVHLDNLAVKKGKQLRQILIDGAKETGGHHTYVNYAHGDETLQEIYGSENVARLLKLKKEYDPLNRFRFYAPLISGSGHTTGAERERDEL